MDRYLTLISAIACIESRLGGEIDCADLARSVGFSLAHLREMFVQTTGRTLARYILSRRAARAAFQLLHTDGSVGDIAAAHGFGSHDSFTRAFRRITGLTPEAFRAQRPPLGRVKLCAGVYGVGFLDGRDAAGGADDAAGDLRVGEGSAVLYGVPRVGYGTYGGCTPYPICLKACANYLGDELAYEEIMVKSAAAFRLTWDTTCWNPGNVDVCFAFDDYASSFATGLHALGRSFRMLMRTPDATKEQFMAFIREEIGAGRPVIALGVIGPPEACIVTGYRDEGQTLLGWNFFQDNPEFRGSACIDESGYFSTQAWWENRNTHALFAIGECTGERMSLADIAGHAACVLSGRQHKQYAKGILAYDYWHRAMGSDAEFPAGAVISLLAERLMVHGDATDCLSDGRSNAGRYFARLAEEGGADADTCASLAGLFCQNGRCIMGMFHLLGGWERGEEQMRRLAQPAVRREICALIEEAKAADAQALRLLHTLARA